ncbi:MAG: hypothetical protein RLZZ142_2291 [Verrucomicrobiota bacterium]|jgi:formylglycine-generating enzyme required for sulfatase activity
MKPATRSAVIVLGMMSVGGFLSLYWVYREASRVYRQQVQERALRAPLGMEMSWVSAGKFTMGANGGMPEERPLHDVKLRGFWMDRFEVTNAQFSQFVEKTGYVTGAEKPGEDGREAGSMVFREGEVGWSFVKGANWRHPEGPGSEIGARMASPVVHVNWYDAVAYAKWAQKRLPTEAEWEYGARGGLEQNPYPWGREAFPKGLWLMNVWQGAFPMKDEGVDSFRGLAPGGAYPPNGYGLHEMAGNAAEWVADWYATDFYQKSPRENPSGPEAGADGEDPSVAKKGVRGGSFLSGDHDRKSFRLAARGRRAPTYSASDLGFRCVKDGVAP